MKILFAIFFAVLPFFLGAETDVLPDQPPLYETLLGLTPTELYTQFGAPLSVRTVRGPEEWQDDVVFTAQDSVEFYFFSDRVWQIKLSIGASGGIRCLKLGAVIPPDTAENGLHQISQTEAETIFELTKTSYPVRVSAWTDRSGIISALYIYRADY